MGEQATGTRRAADQASDTATRFKNETANHVMTVLRDEGLYRHVRFQRVTTDPETGQRKWSSFYWFDLITWPGCLAINGDCGSFMFSRSTDMFEFFRIGGSVNPQYWAEKVCGETRVRSYSEDKFRRLVIEHFVDAVRGGGTPRGLGKAVRAEILGSDELYCEDGARQALAEFAYYRNERDRYSAKAPDFEFCDTWEWDLHDWDWQFLWCCHAIRWGISQYDAGRRPQSREDLDRAAGVALSM